MQGCRIQVAGPGNTEFRCDAEDTILRAALCADVGMSYECNSGGCGSCQFELLEGEVAELWPQAPGLSERAKARGRHLACQCVPLSDCLIKTSVNEKPIPIKPHRSSLSFIDSRPLTGDMSEFRFQAGEKAQFLPGQYAMLGLPGVTGLRAYSMANLANDEGQWRFVIKRVPGGTGTAVLFDTLAPGDSIALDGPYGNSYLRVENDRDIVCVAGGSGLSPVLSILSGAVRAPELADRQLHLFYGGRGPEDICVEKLFADDQLLTDRVNVHVAISDDNSPGADQWQGQRGFIHKLVQKALGDRIPDYDFYFCGPPPMTDAVHRMLLLDYKVPAAQLYFDRFF